MSDWTFIAFPSTTLLGHLRRHNHLRGSIDTLAVQLWSVPQFGMQRSGGGEVFDEINVNSRRPLIPIVELNRFVVRTL